MIRDWLLREARKDFNGYVKILKSLGKTNPRTAVYAKHVPDALECTDRLIAPDRFRPITGANISGRR
jgi:hypothetical protein